MHILNICSPTWKLVESYGRIALELERGLIAAGTQVNRVGDSVHQPVITNPVVGGIFLGWPTLWNLFGPMANIGPRIAITMFESTQLPAGWVEELNTMDAVIVPSRWLVDVFRQCGVTVPIHVVPLGISSAFQQVKPRSTADNPLTFITYADRGWRKGWWHVLRAFNNAYGASTAARLIIKIRDGRVLKAMALRSNIDIIDDELTDDQLVDLYHRCHILVSANCVEGFGFTPREFAATGGLTLATNWGGTADDLHWWGVPIAYTLDTAWRDDPEWHGQLGQWAEPDVESLAILMRHVGNHYAAYQDFAVRAAGFVNTHYRWPLFVHQVNAIWEDVLEKRYGRSDTSGVGSVSA